MCVWACACARARPHARSPMHVCFLFVVSVFRVRCLNLFLGIIYPIPPLNQSIICFNLISCLKFQYRGIISIQHILGIRWLIDSMMEISLCCLLLKDLECSNLCSLCDYYYFLNWWRLYFTTSNNSSGGCGWMHSCHCPVNNTDLSFLSQLCSQFHLQYATKWNTWISHIKHQISITSLLNLSTFQFFTFQHLLI